MQCHLSDPSVPVVDSIKKLAISLTSVVPSRRPSCDEVLEEAARIDIPVERGTQTRVGDDKTPGW